MAFLPLRNHGRWLAWQAFWKSYASEINRLIVQYEIPQVCWGNREGRRRCILELKFA